MVSKHMQSAEPDARRAAEVQKKTAWILQAVPARHKRVKVPGGVVLKPAEQSPLTALRLSEPWRMADGPADDFQVLTTSDPSAFSEVFLSDSRIRKLSFTGSTDAPLREGCFHHEAPLS